MSKLTFFVKTFMAIMEGDKAEVIALKINDRSKNAIKAQISSLEGDTMDFEEEVTTAKENLEKATVNYGDSNFDKTVYVSKLISSKNNLTEKEDNLEEHLSTINFLKERLVLIND